VAKKDVEQQFLTGEGKRGSMTGGTCDHYCLNINILGKAAVLHFALPHFCSWVCTNSACRLFDIAVFMSNSHRLLVISSPHF
jgi:hypothetical protein